MLGSGVFELDEKTARAKSPELFHDQLPLAPVSKGVRGRSVIPKHTTTTLEKPQSSNEEQSVKEELTSAGTATDTPVPSNSADPIKNTISTLSTVSKDAFDDIPIASTSKEATIPFPGYFKFECTLAAKPTDSSRSSPEKVPVDGVTFFRADAGPSVLAGPGMLFPLK